MNLMQKIRSLFSSDSKAPEDGDDRIIDEPVVIEDPVVDPVVDPAVDHDDEPVFDEPVVEIGEAASISADPSDD